MLLSLPCHDETHMFNKLLQSPSGTTAVKLSPEGRIQTYFLSIGHFAKSTDKMNVYKSSSLVFRVKYVSRLSCVGFKETKVSRW